MILLTSVALAVGVVRLGGKGTLVQELYGIETLARVDTLCLDKTGTLTKGEMAVERLEPVGCTEADMRRELGRFLSAFDDPTPLAGGPAAGHSPRGRGGDGDAALLLRPEEIRRRL